MATSSSKLKNVTLLPRKTRGGDDSWVLVHEDGWEDLFFGYYANHLLETKQSQFNTREKYCRFVAGFVDYLIEASKWYLEGTNRRSLTTEYGQYDSAGSGGHLSGPALLELIRIYPKVLAGGAHSKDPVVVELSRRLGRRVVKRPSQTLHIVAINHYLQLSEDFNIRMRQSGMSQVGGMELFSEASLFPHMGTVAELTPFERMAMSSKSMIGGVVAGGPKLKRLAGLKPVVLDEDTDDHYDYDSAFPLEASPELITSGFLSFRDRALYCFLMASGVRISEALALTWHDVDFANRKVYIRNPRAKDLDNVYLGYFSSEERSRLPWKGRAHSGTFLLEPYASEFWRLLEQYMKTEMLATHLHPFIFQVLKGENASSPLLLSDHSNLRKGFTQACKRIDVDPVYSPHSLRHMYGVYCLNYFPRADGTFGLPPSTVKDLLGHASLESTMNYAKPDMELLEVEQRVNTAVLDGFHVVDRSEMRLKVLEQMVSRMMSEINDQKKLAS